MFDITQRYVAPMPGRFLAMFLLIGVMVAGSGCRTVDVQSGDADVSSELSSRFGEELPSTEIAPGEALLPPGVSTADGITANEAVGIALWNNAAYRELLAQLGISNAQLFDACLISDPQFVIFFPLGPKQLEFTLYQAVDALWLRAVRVRAAELDLERVSQTMVQNGLDVIRDVRVAHADLLLAQKQAELANEAESIRREVATLTQKRLADGDISELEAMTSQVDALLAEASTQRAQYDVELARQRMRTLIGLTVYADTIDAVDEATTAENHYDAESLVNTALAMRPDLRAVEIEVESSCERLRLAQRQFMSLDMVYDANGSGRRGFESGPGLRFTIPIFNRNRGGIAIAQAQYEQAEKRYVTVRDRVVLEVEAAYTQLEQAEANLQLLRDKILPTLKQAEELARRNYQNGGATYFLVLQTTGQYLDARVRELQLLADLQRARAELERSVGMRLTTSSETRKTDQPLELPVAPAVTTIQIDAAGLADSGWRPTRSVVASQNGDLQQTDQESEYVQVTHSVQLDPGRQPAGVPTGTGGTGEEDGAREDRASE